MPILSPPFPALPHSLRAFTRTDGRNSNLWHQITIGGLYRALEMMAYQDSEAWQIPLDHMVELGMAVEI